MSVIPFAETCWSLRAGRKHCCPKTPKADGLIPLAAGVPSRSSADTPTVAQETVEASEGEEKAKESRVETLLLMPLRGTRFSPLGFRLFQS
jgi:hypothetical protein